MKKSLCFLFCTVLLWVSVLHAHPSHLGAFLAMSQTVKSPVQDIPDTRTHTPPPAQFRKGTTGFMPRATIVVDTFTDEYNDAGFENGFCSLREAIQAANWGGPFDSCLGSMVEANTINLPAGTYTLTLSGTMDDNNESGDLDINSMETLTIQGAGADETFIDGNTLDRVIHITSSAVEVIINDVTIRNGQAGAGDNGGGIYNQANLTLNRCSIENNSSSSFGGGISTDGSLTMDRSSVIGNNGYDGGGIYTELDGAFTITNSTISGNSSDNSGGGILSLTNTSPATVDFVTITNNSGNSSGGGVSIQGINLETSNSIFAGNSSTMGPDVDGSVTSDDYNLIGNDSESSGFNGINDIVGTDISPIDPGFLILADNGGTTKTHSLMIDSPAVDAADPTSLVVLDQRGETRPEDGNNDNNIYNDIGAFELSEDADGDGVLNSSDNCPNISNAGQENSDSDTYGDACDNCPYDTNQGQENSDGDSDGDICDLCPDDPDNDADSDGLCGDIDNCPDTSNADQEDIDGNGIGDACQMKVNSVADVVDLTPGDGSCNTGNTVPGGDPECTLRAAIQEINALGEYHGIFLYDPTSLPTAGTEYPISIIGEDEDSCATGDLDITHSLDIIGVGARFVSINANSYDRGLHIQNGRVSLTGITLTNGSMMTPDSSGGALLIDTGVTSVDINECMFSSSAANSGGGITIEEGTVTIANSTIYSNSAWAGNGAGILNSGNLEIVNSTISTNENQTDMNYGGGIYNSAGATLSVISSTIAQNSFMMPTSGTGGGIYNAGTIDNLINTVLSGNSAMNGPDLEDVGVLSLAQYNLIMDAMGHSITHGIDGNIVGQEALLDPLANNGGPTYTLKPNLIGPSNPVIDAGSCLAAGTYLDQRGVLRPKNVFDKANVADGCDIGAYEEEDLDGDGISDLTDNCPDIFNDMQEDVDGDGVGDACDFYDPSWTDGPRLDEHRYGHTATLMTDGNVLVVGGHGVGEIDSAELYNSDTNTWTVTGSLNTRRAEHTATLLPSGKVMVVGGSYFDGSDNVYLASVEIYDPATKEWTKTEGVLSTPRIYHTATLLPDGRVFIAGGYNDPGTPEYLTSVEIIDPENLGSTFTATPMGKERINHTATLLPNGKVMIVGGYNPSDSYMAFVEVYDPAQDLWIAKLSMTEGRGFHTATLIPDGTVLVVGGHNTPFGTLSSCEIYYPDTDFWGISGGLNTGRKQHSTTLIPNGKLLVVGGNTGAIPAMNSTELYSPSLFSFQNLETLTTARCQHTATLLPSGKILIAGGDNSGTLASTELFDPTTGGVWQTLTDSFDLGRYEHSATLLPDGRVIAAGGRMNPDVFHNTVEIYSPAIDQWSPTGNMTDLRTNHTATLLPDGDVLVTGGYYNDPADHFLSTCELFDASLGTWTPTTGGMTYARRNHTATLLPDGKVLVAGGDDEPAGTAMVRDECEIYNPDTGLWTSTGSLNIGRTYHSATLLPDGKVIVAGGNIISGSVQDLSACELYDPETGLWTPTGSMSEARHHHTATLLSNGKVLVTGGTNLGSSTLLTAELYDPETGLWSTTGPMNSKRQNHQATLLHNGKVLITGGYEYMAVEMFHRSIELYDPVSEVWLMPPMGAGELQYDRSDHSAVLLNSGIVLISGGLYDSVKRAHAGRFSSEFYLQNEYLNSRRPLVYDQSDPFTFGLQAFVEGYKFRGDSEASSGSTQNSAANFPLTRIRSLENGHTEWLVMDERLDFWDDPMALTFNHLPASLNPGWYSVTVYTHGVPSESAIVRMECSIAVTTQPANITVAAGNSHTFTVEAEGARYYRWQKNSTDIPGATNASYTTPAIEDGDHGSIFRCVISNGCTSAVSNGALLSVLDETDPTVTVITPNGGESWAYSESDTDRRSHLVVWESADNFDLGKVELLYTSDGTEWSYMASSDSTYFSGDTPLAIPDPGFTASTVNVPYSGMIQDINITANLTHPNDSDLTITLIGPDLTEVVLSNRRGSDGDNFTSTIFDDEAVNPISAGTAPFTGSFQPDEVLSAYDDSNLKGNWQLKVTDNADNSRAGTLDSWSITFDIGGGTPNPYDTNYLWVMPTQSEAADIGQTFPSATSKVKVIVHDETGNSNFDNSDNNFYIIQPTTTSIRTLLVWDSGRFDTKFGTTAKDAMLLKLKELADHSKVTGVVLDLAAVPAVQTAYTAWDDDALTSSNPTLANNVAAAIQSYLKDQANNTYTNTQYLILVGDDNQIPLYRMVDGATIYAEGKYPPEVSLSTANPVGYAINAGYFFTDNYYSELTPENTGLSVPHNLSYLNDFAIGRLVETPAQITGVINTYLAQDGQINVTEVTDKVLVTGLDFLYDSSYDIRGSYVSASKTTDCLLDDPTLSGNSDPCIDKPFTPADYRTQIFTSSPTHKIANINTHANHYAFAASVEATPSGGDVNYCTDPSYAANCYASGMTTEGKLTGTIIYSSGCHSGLPIPSTDTRSLDLPELMATKEVVAYIGNTGYGWGMKYGKGLTESLMEGITSEILSNDSIAIGKALANAKRTYHIQEKRYDVFDEKVLHELTLFGIPNYLIVTSTESKISEEEELPPPDGPDKGCANGICLEKSLQTEYDLEALPTGVTALDLNFTFGGGTYVKLTTTDGDYYKLNGKSSGEVGDAIQPHFVYNSSLSGTTAHGVLYTGGSYTEELAFNPVIAVPNSTPTDGVGDEGPLPSGSLFVPSVRVSFGVSAGSVGRAIGEVGYTNMVVHTGYCENYSAGTCTENKYDDMQFTVYYSINADVTSPAVTDPGGGGFHSLNGLTATFTATVTDGSGVYRVIVTYNDRRTDAWKSLDLTNTPSTTTWTGTLSLKGNITYYVQAVDIHGNVGMLSSSGGDTDSNGTPYGSLWSGPKTFNITLLDTDSDTLPDAYEDLYPDACLDKTQADAGTLAHTCADGPNTTIDYDNDCLSSLKEFTLDTNPCDGDSDTGGENDGSELAHNRSLTSKSDDKHIQITVVESGADAIIEWPDGSAAAGDCTLSSNQGDNNLVNGYYFVYRSTDPFFDPTEKRSGTIADGVQCYKDVGAGTLYYYKVWNYEVDTYPPVVSSVVPATGSTAGNETVEIYGKYFISGAKVYFDTNLATSVTVVTSNLIQCTTPAHAAGAVTVKVINPNNQEGSKATAFTYE